jgi:NADPH:quinone reductase-like Zn-dependent oxidoreductase
VRTEQRPNAGARLVPAASPAGAPVLDRTHPLDEAADAFRYVAAGHTRGKVVVTV